MFLPMKLSHWQITLLNILHQENSMTLLHIRVECPGCGSTDLEEIKREVVKVKHFTEHRIVLRCRDCGKEVVVG